MLWREQVDLYRRAAPCINRILNGEKAGDLPIQEPVKFDLVINLKTAKRSELPFRRPCKWRPTR